MTNISFVNESTVVADNEVVAAASAFQTQVSRDLKSTWGMDANLAFLHKGEVPKPTDWVIAILDDSDQAGALGYHDVTVSGQPLAKIFAKTDKENGYSWTVTTSHELLEMLGDPQLCEATFIQNDVTSGVLYARELCDACEADQYGYLIDGILVSDFVLPTWFQPDVKSSKKDFCGHIKSAFELLPGGYISVFAIPNSGDGWTMDQHAEQGKSGMRSPQGGAHSRRERRRLCKWKYRQ